MPFHPITIVPGSRLTWDDVTHIKLLGRKPDTPAAQQRYETLLKLADADGIIAKDVAFRELTPQRNLSSRIRGIQADLRCYALPRDHGNNSQNKGWLLLGRMV